jgi:hypothetical protein
MLERVKAARYGVISAPRKRVTPVTAIGEPGRFGGPEADDRSCSGIYDG